MRYLGSILLLALWAHSISAQPPWDTDTVDYNAIRPGISPAEFEPKYEALNTTRYYKFGRDVEVYHNDERVTVWRVKDFETGEFFDLRFPKTNFPRRHMDTLNMKTKHFGDFVHHNNGVTTFLFRKSVNYKGKGQYFVQYNHNTDTWSELIHAGFINDLQYLRKFGFDHDDKYFYYALAQQEARIQPDPRYAPEYNSTQFELFKLDLKNFKNERMFTLRMPKREKVLHFKGEFITPDDKFLILLEYDDAAYSKAAPNDPPPVAYIVDVENNTFESVEIPWTAYGQAISPDSKYLFLGSYLKGTMLKIDIAEAKVEKKIQSNKLMWDFYMAPSGNYFLVTYHYEKYPRKVVDFRSTEDLSLVSTVMLEDLFGKGAKDDYFFHTPSGFPLMSRAKMDNGNWKKAPAIVHNLPDYIVPPTPGSQQELALRRAESIAAAKQYMKNTRTEIAKDKHVPDNVQAVGFAADGNVIISGERYLTGNSTATYVAKLSPKGNKIWETKIPAKEGASSSPGYHVKMKDGGCILFTRYYHKLSSFGCSRITRLGSSGNIIYDYKFIRQPNPGHKDVDWNEAILNEDGSLQLEGLSFIERKQFGQGDWRNLFRPWTGTMSVIGKFTDTTKELLEPREKSYWRQGKKMPTW